MKNGIFSFTLALSLLVITGCSDPFEIDAKTFSALYKSSQNGSTDIQYIGQNKLYAFIQLPNKQQGKTNVVIRYAKLSQLNKNLQFELSQNYKPVSISKINANNSFFTFINNLLQPVIGLFKTQ